MDKNSTAESTSSSRLAGLTQELDLLSQKVKENQPVSPEQTQSLVSPETPLSPPTPPAQASMAPDSVLPPPPVPTPPNEKKKSKVFFWIISVILLLALLGVGGFVLLGDKATNFFGSKTTPSPTPTPFVGATPIPTPILTPSPSAQGKDEEASNSGKVEETAKIYCGSPRPDNCPLLPISSPPYLCGSDGLSYSNPCMACANSKLDYYFVSQDACSSK
jgi:hypothetical protein